MKPAPDSDRRKPTTVCERTPACPQRNRSPTPTSASSTRGRSGGTSERSRDRRVRIDATQAADSRKLRASMPSRVAGCTTASSTPASIGTPRSSSAPNPHSAELAEPIRSRPTMAGSAPNAAPSKNTNAVWVEEAGDQRVHRRQRAEREGDRHRRDGQPGHDVGHHHDPPPVEPVGQGAGEQPEQQVGHALDHRDERGERRAAAEPVDQHRQRDRGDERAGDGHLARHPVAAEVAVVAQRHDLGCPWPHPGRRPHPAPRRVLAHSADAAALPADLPENRQPPTKVPSSAR